MRIDLNAILKLIEVGAAIAPGIIRAVRGGQLAVTGTRGEVLSADDVEWHVNQAETARAKVSDATVGRIEDRDRE